jgi:hypothetical protein
MPSNSVRAAAPGKPADEPPEHLVKVRFRASGLKVLAVQPIDDENVHRGE